jgi:hypothetical protein
MGSSIKEILIGIPILIYVFWVFTAPMPASRIERFCEPINWVGNVATSTTALSAEGHTTTTVRWSDKLNYSCKYMVWRLFYQEAYNKAVESGLIKPVDGVQQADDAPTTEKTTTLPGQSPKVSKPEAPAAEPAKETK